MDYKTAAQLFVTNKPVFYVDVRNEILIPCAEIQSINFRKDKKRKAIIILLELREKGKNCVYVATLDKCLTEKEADAYEKTEAF